MFEDRKYKPLSPWSYFGYELLFQIPVAGLILLIVYSFSGKNINRRNFARAHFCALAVVVILVAIFTVLSLIFGFTDAVLGFFTDSVKKL